MLFEKRKIEAHAELTKTTETMSGREITSKKDQGNIRSSVDDYFDLREKILLDALNILGDGTKKGKELREKWENHLGNKGSESIRILSEALKDKKDTQFTRVISDLISQESIFYLKLGNMPFPDLMRGNLLEYKQEFIAERESLKDKWEKLIADNKIINISIDDHSVKLFNTYKDGLNKVKNGYITLRELITVQMKAFEMVDNASSLSPSIYTHINNLIDLINIFMITNQDMAYRFDQLYKSEDIVAVVMFGNTRTTVKEFLANTNLDKATREYNESEKHALENANNMLTKGQQEDALLLVKEASKITKEALLSFTEVYNLFIDQFKEIFIGPVGNRTVNDLINKERWDWAKNEWKVIDIQSELKKIYDDDREWINIDMFSELQPEVKKQIETSLAKERDRLRLALNQVGDHSVFNAIKTFMTITKDLTLGKIMSS